MTMLAVILILLAVADVATTQAFLRAGLREANPLMRTGYERFGFWPTSAVKLVFTAGVAYLMRDHPSLLRAACVIQGAAVVWNMYLIWRADRA